MTPGAPDLPDALRCALAGVAAAAPGPLVERALDAEPLTAPVSIVAVGKGAPAMARAALDRLGGRVRHAIVVAPEHAAAAHTPLPADPRVRAFTAGHPLPTPESVRAGSAVAALADALGADDTLLLLLSGGASALLARPPAPLTLDDLRDATHRLLRNGAAIAELNCVRKHLDALKGGQLAARAWPARTVALVLSDVVGDALDVIGSGPATADPTTAADAVALLRARGVWDTLTPAVRAHLGTPAADTPAAGDPRLARATARVIGDGAVAARAARDTARALGYHARIVTTAMTGEAREVGARIAHAATDATIDAAGASDAGGPRALVYAGETTVTRRGEDGVGGRSQELALAAAIALDGQPGVTLAAIGTDGVDGPTDAAGAIATGATLAQARAVGLHASDALRRHDAYPFWRAAGGLVVTGPTGTNVADLVVVTIGTPAGSGATA